MKNAPAILRSPDRRLELWLDDAGGILRFFENAADGPVEYFHRPAGNRCPLMHPWCNRVEAGAFRFEGQEHVLRPLHAPENNALHGNWLLPWRVTREGGDAARLDITCRAEDGATHKTPYAYAARQHLRLTNEGLGVTISLTNQGETLPFGLGLHPFLPRPQDTRVEMTARMMENCQADMIPDPAAPVVPVPAAWTLETGFTVSNANLAPARRGFGHADLMDNCFVEIDPAEGARIAWPGTRREMHMTASANCRFGVIFVPGAANDAPPGELSYFCVELCTNGINMQNRRPEDAGAIVLRQGEALQVETQFRIREI